MSLAPGTRLGPYEIGPAIGAGGMGEVYLATDRTLDRQVAIKVLPASFAADADRVARFQREAKTLAALNHANIAQIYGLERGDGATALVMELVEGDTLADRLLQGALPADEALAIAMQIADALAAAHSHGIVHRDLKPANIKLTAGGTVKVLDFGIAKVLDTRSSSGPQAPTMHTPAHTETGMVLGTAAYMSPEQARGKHVDQRADIWAFGVVLFEMLTGRMAFAGEDVTVTLARVLERPVDLSVLPATLPPAVRHTLGLCLQKEVDKRIADIRDVKLALAGAFDSGARDTRAIPAPAPRWQRTGLVAGLFASALVAGAAVWLVTRPGPPPPLPVSRLLVTPPATAPLASLGGYEMTISPDGTQLAYFAARDDSRIELYLRDLDELEARLVPGTEVDTSGGNMLPFYSPDGRSIGYRAPGNGIMRVSVSGGAPLKIVDDAIANNPQYLGAAWTDDDTLIFSSGFALHRVSTGGGGTPEQVTPEVKVGDERYVAPVMLPGGAVLVSREDLKLAVFNPQTRQERIVVQGGHNPFYARSGHIVFARGSTLMAVPFDLKTLTMRGDPVALIQGVRYPGPGTGADYGLSASGTLVYVPRGNDETSGRELVWVGRDGQVLEPAIPERIDNARSPRLSPDNRQLVLTSGSTPNPDIWIYDLGGQPPIPLAIEFPNFMGMWSPDGKRVAFGSARGGGVAVYTLPADGSVLDATPVNGSDGAGPAAWSDRGDLILVSFDDLGIHALAEAGGERRDVVVTADDEFDAALSPDGRWLAYVSTRTGVREVWVKAYPEGVPRRVSRNGGIEPRWSGDGKELFYLQGSDEADGAMMAVAVETGAELAFGPAVELFRTPYFFALTPQNASYDVAADGRFLMIQEPGSASGGGGSASMVVVQNWIEELNRLVPIKQ